MSYAVAGVQLGVAQAGIKKANHDDLVVIALAPGTRTSALFKKKSKTKQKNKQKTKN